MSEYKQPDWYDEEKLVKIKYAEDERGWAIFMGNGQYRVANDPLDGEANWGDLVILISDGLKVIERYDPEMDRIDEESGE